MPVTYNPNIPQATDQLSQSQADILNNFTIIQPTFDQDHIDFNDPANPGMHKWVELPTPGIPTAVAGTINLFSKLNATTGRNELYVQPSVLPVLPITDNSVPITASSPAANGWTYLPSGIILVWGNSLSNVNPTTHLPFTIPFPNNCFSITATLSAAFSHNDTINVAIGDKTYFTCSIKNTSGTQEARNFFYLAIGN